MKNFWVGIKQQSLTITIPVHFAYHEFVALIMTSKYMKANIIQYFYYILMKNKNIFIHPLHHHLPN
jgi:hypothetical protein